MNTFNLDRVYDQVAHRYEIQRNAVEIAMFQQQQRVAFPYRVKKDLVENEAGFLGVLRLKKVEQGTKEKTRSTVPQIQVFVVKVSI